MHRDQTTLEINVEPEVTGQSEQTFESIAAEDGRIRESGEESSTGGAAWATVPVLFIGDDPLDRQYLAILSFDTSSLPSTATITAARLELTRGPDIGPDPFPSYGPLVIDLVAGSFGTEALEPGDFEAPADLAQVATLAHTWACVRRTRFGRGLPWSRTRPGEDI